jgi:hypothetical protein
MQTAELGGRIRQRQADAYGHQPNHDGHIKHIEEVSEMDIPSGPAKSVEV